MASNIKSVGLGNSYTLQAYFNETGTNTPGNYSTVYVEAKLMSGSIKWSSSYNSYLRVYWHDNRENYDRLVGETALSGCEYNSSYFAAGTINVTHNGDGNLSGYAYATFTKGGTSSYAPNTGGVATDWTALTYLPRSATIDTFTGNDVDGSFKVTYTKKSDSFTHKLRISIPSVKSLETFNYVSGTSFYLTDESKDYIYNYAKTNQLQSVTLGAVIETWSGGSKIGDSTELKNVCSLGAISKLFINNDWKRATPHIRINNEWKIAIPYIRINNEWKRSR